MGYIMKEVKGPKIIKYTGFYKDDATNIKKRSFVMQCRNCIVYQKNNLASRCKNLGYCKFSKFYDEMNDCYSDEQKMRTVKIMMSSYNRPRG